MLMVDLVAVRCRTSHTETSNMDSPGESNVVADVLSAAGANLVALVVGYPLAILAPGFLVLILPFGVFWAYLLLVGLYAFSQFRKGRRRRAILAGSLAAIVLMFLAMNIRVA